MYLTDTRYRSIDTTYLLLARPFWEFSQKVVKSRSIDATHLLLAPRNSASAGASPHFTTVAKIALVLGVSLDEVAHEAGIPIAIYRKTPVTAAAEIRRGERLDAALRHLDRAREQIVKASEA